MWRRYCLAGLAGSWLLTAAVHAQSPAAAAAAPMKAVGVFSMLGDAVDVSVATEAPRDTRLDTTARMAMDFKGIGFDLIALRAARDVLRRERPAAQVSVFKAPVEMNAADQRSLAAGARNAELPAWMVKTIEENRLSHVLLLTRSRGVLNAKTSDGNDLGRSTVDGIGFHMDTLYTINNPRTGAVSTGLLAPHAYFRLMLMDAQSGEIVANYEVRDAYAHAAPDSQAKADPWIFMSNEDKVRVLRRMVETGTQRGLAEVLRQP